MSDLDNDHRHAVALFRYGLIADLAQTPGTKGLYRRLEEKAAPDYTIPGSARTRVAPETLRDWLKRYRQGGFEALMPKPRTDRGRSRALPDAVVELLLSLKETKPTLSVPLLIRKARATGQIPEELPLPPSTVHRLPARHGLMRKHPEQPTERDRRSHPAQDLPHRLPRSSRKRGCHTGHPLRRLRALGEHPSLLARVQTGPDAPGPAPAPVCRYRRQFSLSAPRTYLRETRDRADPCQSVPAPRQGKVGTLVSDPTRPAVNTPHSRGHPLPRGAQPPALGLGRGRIPSHPPSWARRGNSPGALGKSRR